MDEPAFNPEPEHIVSFDDSVSVHAEDLYRRDIEALYDMLRVNHAYELRTPEAELEREAILREIVELESLTAA